MVLATIVTCMLSRPYVITKLQTNEWASNLVMCQRRTKQLKARSNRTVITLHQKAKKSGCQGKAHRKIEQRASSTSTCDETPRGYRDLELSECDSLPLGAEW